MGVLKNVAEGIGDILTGGAVSARKDAKKARKKARAAQEQATEEAREDRTRRQNFQRAALQRSPSLFDLLGGPDA